ncbi:hypothetical protein DSL72_002048 [Monilinia vaccinii-corymbosi]|uniref:Uncharacterized protein n=1 Tax=Monilinia vaccinii-corymbosi TaxID=61207 RepID=A0A8A3PBI6_9HELO|nr:hypothetical protein DSL72_002048 [Monilinia vaccinii-corymbosi]
MSSSSTLKAVQQQEEELLKICTPIAELYKERSKEADGLENEREIARGLLGGPHYTGKDTISEMVIEHIVALIEWVFPVHEDQASQGLREFIERVKQILGGLNS